MKDGLMGFLPFVLFPNAASAALKNIYHMVALNSSRPRAAGKTRGNHRRKKVNRLHVSKKVRMKHRKAA